MVMKFVPGDLVSLLTWSGELSLQFVVCTAFGSMKSTWPLVYVIPHFNWVHEDTLRKINDR